MDRRGEQQGDQSLEVSGPGLCRWVRAGVGGLQADRRAGERGEWLSGDRIRLAGYRRCARLKAESQKLNPE